jgi:hypothetical protein
MTMLAQLAVLLAVAAAVIAFLTRDVALIGAATVLGLAAGLKITRSKTS